MRAFSITALIRSGFGAVSVGVAMIVAFSYFSAESLGNGYSQYRDKSQQTLIIKDFVEDLFEARMASISYRVNPTEKNAEAVFSNIAEVERDAQNLNLFVSNPVLLAELQALAEVAVEYRGHFSRYLEVRAETATLNEDAIEYGSELNTALENLQQLGFRSRSISVLRMTSSATQAIQGARIDLRDAVQLGNAQMAQTAGEGFAAVRAEVEKIEPHLRDSFEPLPKDDMIAQANDMIAKSISLEQASVEIAALLREATMLTTERLDVIGPDMQSRFEVALDSIVEDQTVLGTEGAALVVRMEWLTPLAGGLVLGACVIIALAVSGMVTRPIKRLAQTTKRLAEGQIDVEITGSDQQTEIGTMARALEQFRAALERDKAAKVKASEARAEQVLVVNELSRALQGLSDGDLSYRITTPLGENYEELRQNYNASVDTLNSLVGSVVQNAASIKNGSSEISRSSSDLAERTEKQAISLERTAAALEELTSSVRSTAESSSEANTFAGDVRKKAVDSSIVVTDAMSAMSRIEESSNQIKKTVDLIEDIAFQTNLLALNAGVEAARAGDAGSGFAVVASEVRALAQRASSAAKEIGGMISNSSEQVNMGVDLVGKTGASLTEITQMVEAVSRHIADISTASKEQAASLSEMNTAIVSLDQMAQRNAAMAEEATAAGEQLHNEANQLQSLTAKFRVGPDSVAGASHDAVRWVA